MLDLSSVPLPILVAGFLACTMVIAFAGPSIAHTAGEIARRTRLGEAMVGALLLGACTSLPGIVTSVAAAAGGHPALAISNAVGGIAIQTAFLAVADIAYRSANLEHAAASIGNLLNGALLIVLLSLPLIAAAGPDPTVFGISLFSLLILSGYGFGYRIVSAAQDQPMWQARQTKDTQIEGDPNATSGRHMARIVVVFVLLAAALGAAGFGLAQTAVALSDRTGISQTAIGGLLTAFVTSLPELVTSVAAVRKGFLNLAVGGIIGGNAFDVLFLSFADIAYRPGSLYGELQQSHQLVLATTILMTGILLLGLLVRQRRGPAGIGFESILILAAYGAIAATLATG